MQFSKRAKLRLDIELQFGDADVNFSPVLRRFPDKMHGEQGRQVLLRIIELLG